MARSDTPNLSARPVRAEVPPANYWQRWSVANAAPGDGSAFTAIEEALARGQVP